MTVHVTLWLKEEKKKVWFLDRGERRLFRSLQTCLCFCNPSNTGVVILFGLHPSNPSSPYTLWFDRFLQGLKGKLMLLQVHVFCFVFNSWYLLVILSISILANISLFIWTLVVTSFVVSNRHRHYTLTAGSVVLHIIIVIITILYFCFPLISAW